VPCSELVYLSVQILNVLKNTGLEIIEAVGKLFAKPEKNMVIVPHENPDGDAVGSALGLAGTLKNAGHTVHVLSPNNYPDFLKWFSSSLEVVVYEKNKKKGKQLLSEADVLVCVDFNEAKRAGYLEKKVSEFTGKKVLIDHHPHPTYFCDYTISEPTYSSTAELVYELLAKTGYKSFMGRNEAEALFTGILTDTGSFSHNTSNPNTFKVVSELLQFGINTDRIQSNVYHKFSAKRMQLLGYCLAKKMEVFEKYRAAVICITKKELEDFDFTPGDTEGFVNYPLSIKNIVFSALFIEKEGFVKASFRSKGSFAANSFSREHFDGGGHLNAAGGESKLNLTETINKFKQLLPAYLHQLRETKI